MFDLLDNVRIDDIELSESDDDTTDKKKDTLDLKKTISNISNNKEEQAALYLSCFYSGRNTQSSLTDFIEAVNFQFKTEIPTTFDGLCDIIFGRKRKFAKQKIYFCIFCLKTINLNQNERIRRTCPNCQSRYFIT